MEIYSAGTQKKEGEKELELSSSRVGTLSTTSRRERQGQKLVGRRLNVISSLKALLGIEIYDMEDHPVPLSRHSQAGGDTHKREMSKSEEFMYEVVIRLRTLWWFEVGSFDFHDNGLLKTISNQEEMDRNGAELLNSPYFERGSAISHRENLPVFEKPQDFRKRNVRLYLLFIHSPERRVDEVHV
ncbi:hypothetical protein GALMADRAFT_774755 [Galerina marginata CBS 339.88]|uniref:Uncharacterized protein n=1 Tax=Galerina marginata (strain CBS 339.88) TaxID=685588 RepID=A0A067SWN3_GALM3|nr:hypothetical protein GALMADRAFT_774755 [Galerina marginata CBS 339.88]